jgi:hypothetical protein
MSIDRRTFLKLGGVGILGVTFTPLLGGCEEFIVTQLVEPKPVLFNTPQSEFFIQNGGEGSIEGWQQPSIAQNDWRLAIEKENLTAPFIQEVGSVSFADLIGATADTITLLKTMQCILESPVRLTQTGYTGSAYWTGVPLRFFLDRAGLDLTPYKRLRLYGADGFTNNFPVGRILESDGLVQPLLVYQINGEPLTPEHGFPVRLIVQEGYGYMNVKWITKVRASFSDTEFGTYQNEGYVDDGVMRVNSRSTSLGEAISIPSGTTEITGFAVSGFAPISAVEVSIDGGAFQPAEIVPLEEIQSREALPPNILQLQQSLLYPFKAVWTMWRFQWDAPSGNHTVAIRASDDAGNVQPAIDGSFYDGQTAVTRYDVTVS